MTETERLRAALERIKTLANADADGPHEIAGLFADIDTIASDALEPREPTPDTRPELTAAQARILDFIRSEIATQGIPPTTREIGAALGISSPNGVRGHLMALQKKGYLKSTPLKSRTLAVVEAS